ncbi:MAG: hypothetical protein U0Y68_23140 [Blastocatellia bacterium]
MKKVIVVVLFVFTVMFTALAAGDEAQVYQARMKQTGGYMRMLRENFKTTNRPKVISAAQELESVFKQEHKFWTKRGTTDAAKLSKEAQDAAKAIVTASRKGEDDQAAVALKNLTNSCTACHLAHREFTSGCSGRIK